MSETRKLAAILVTDVVGYSRLAGADEDRTLARLRGLRSDLIDPAIAAHHGRIVKRTGDGSIVEFRSVVDAVRCAIEVQNGLIERNGGVPEDRRIEFRVGIHVGDVVEESDGDLMGDGVNIAARLEGVAKPGTICLSEHAYWQVTGRLDLKVTDLGATQLKNIAEPVHVYLLEVGQPALAKPAASATPAEPKPKAQTADREWGPAPLAAAIAAFLLLAAAGGWYVLGGRMEKPAQAAHLSIVVLPFTNLSGDPSQDYFADGVTENLTTELSRIPDSFVIARNTAFTYKGKSVDAKEIGKELRVRYVLEGSVQRDQNRVRVNAQLIDAETGVAVPAAEGEASDSRGRDDSEGHGLSECARGVVDLPRRAARPHPRGAFLGIDPHASHRRQVDHQPVVDTGKSGPIVRTAADRDRQTIIAAEIDGGDHIGCVDAARDQLRALVDHRIVELGRCSCFR